jgi:hypothetical protein
MDRYSKIILLVHPLYDLFYNSKLSSFSNTNSLAKSIKKLDSKKSTVDIKKTLMIYGKFLNENVSKDSVVLLLKPDLVSFYPDNLKVRELSKQYDESLKKFIDFFNRKFENRFCVYQGNTFFDRTEKSVFPKTIYEKLASSLEILSFGEYFSKNRVSNKGCVPSFSNKLLTFLEKKGFSLKIRIAEKYTLPFEKEGGFRKILLPSNQRRKLQNKEKKKKLNLRKKIK